jgi:hygromycin-B 4-O-kinase
MSKPKFELSAIQSAVQQELGPLADWEPLHEGENSQVFAAVGGAGPVVVRVSNRRKGFEVDRCASRMLADSGVRVPEFHGIGSIEDAWWCVTDRLPGKPLYALGMDRIEAVAPAVADTFDRLHSVDLSLTTGYGGLNPESGNGFHGTWFEWVLGGVPDSWPNVDREEDRKLLEALGELVRAEKHSLEPGRALVHGDCSADNIIVGEDDTVGVIDFECAMIGDPLWDIAYQLYWGGAWPEMAPQARAAVAALEDSVENRARLRFYMVTTGLAGTRFYADDWRTVEVTLMVRRLAPLLETPPSLKDLDGYWLSLGSVREG